MFVSLFSFTFLEKEKTIKFCKTNKNKDLFLLAVDLLQRFLDLKQMSGAFPSLKNQQSVDFPVGDLSVELNGVNKNNVKKQNIHLDLLKKPRKTKDLKKKLKGP